jgi:hypothetical protein
LSATSLQGLVTTHWPDNTASERGESSLDQRQAKACVIRLRDRRATRLRPEKLDPAAALSEKKEAAFAGR